jgi:hypothetical protein
MSIRIGYICHLTPHVAQGVILGILLAKFDHELADI